MASLLVLHTCESSGSAQANADYLERMGDQPHWVFDPSNGDSIALLPVTEHAKALLHIPGRPDTNNREQDGRPGVDVIQVEIVGYAAGSPDQSDEWYSRLRIFIASVCYGLGIPNQYPKRFASSASDDVRFTPEEWADPGLVGIIGHCHVPENTHWDPGALDINRLQPTIEEQIMACIEPTTPITVSGQKYAAVDVLGWLLEGINAMRAAATTGDNSALHITPAMIADELAKRLAA